MPDLRQLRAFVAVAEELNFTRAADRLRTAQQAVSKSVASLERELGVELLERSSRSVRLTAAGAQLLESGREALAAADAAFSSAQVAGRGLLGTVRLGATPAVGAEARAEAVLVLRSAAADLAVSVQEVRPAQVAALLRDREVEAVLARTSSDKAGVASAVLRSTPASLVVPAGHPLATVASARLAQLDGERLLTWNPPGTPYTDLLLARAAAGGARVQAVQARSLGAGLPLDLAEIGAVALVPGDVPIGDGEVRVPLEEEFLLPLRLLWWGSAPSPVVRRLRGGLAPA